MKSYIEQLEEQNEELRQRLATAEALSDENKRLLKVVPKWSARKKVIHVATQNKDMTTIRLYSGTYTFAIIGVDVAIRDFESQTKYYTEIFYEKTIGSQTYENTTLDKVKNIIKENVLVNMGCESNEQ